MNIKQVPINVAIVMPLIGLFDEPIRPTIQDETVTKKAPKTMINSPSSSLLPIEAPGMKLAGSSAIINIKARLPIPTILIERSLSVLGTLVVASLAPFIEPMLPLNEEIIVGMVFIKVINPPAA